MSMSVYNLVGLRYHVRFYTGVISNFYQQWVPKGVVGLIIPIIVRLITIWDKVFFKLRLYFDGLVSRKKVFLDYIHRIETHLDVVVEVLEVKISVAVELCLDEEFIEFWWSDTLFEIPNSTICFCRMSTFQCWSPIVSWDQIGNIMRFWWIMLVWQEFWNFNLIHHWCDHFCEVFCDILHFFIIILSVGLNCILHDE